MESTEEDGEISCFKKADYFELKKKKNKDHHLKKEGRIVLYIKQYTGECSEHLNFLESAHLNGGLRGLLVDKTTSKKINTWTKGFSKSNKVPTHFLKT